MPDILPFDWQAIIYPLLAVGYFQLMAYLDKRWSKKHPLTDQEVLTNLARIMECSEFDIFSESARTWHIPPDHMEADFKRYLITDEVPYYLTDFIRKNGIKLVSRHYDTIHRR